MEGQLGSEILRNSQVMYAPGHEISYPDTKFYTHVGEKPTSGLHMYNKTATEKLNY
jgi:hypothetical protein